jgi:Tfp pilus assembly protein PilF
MSSKTRFAGVALALAMSIRFCIAQAPEDKQQEYARHLQKAQEYLREKQPNLAIPELQAALSINADNFEMQANLGVLLYFHGKFADAVPHLRAALDKQPDLTQIQGLLGIAELRTLDFANGRKDLEAAFPKIQETKFKVQAGLELVGFYTQIGSLEDAAGVLAQLRKDAPDNAEVMYAAYRTYSDLSGESMMALALNAPDSAQMHQLLAHEEIKEGNTNGAIAQYRTAIAIDPHLPGIHFELAELLNTSLDPAVKKDAVQEYRAALQANPLDEKAECKLADIDAADGNTAKAFKEYSKAAELQPTDADAKLGLAKALIEMNQQDKAVPLLEQAVQLEPTNPNAHYRLATLYRKQGREDDARREVALYKQYKDLKEKLRATYKDLLVQPSEIRADERDEK